MFYLFFGLLCGLLAGLPFGPLHWKTKLSIVATVWGPLCALFSWLILPQLVGPFWGIGLWAFTMVSMVVNAFVAFFMNENSSRNETRSAGFSRSLITCFLLLAIPFLGGLRSCSAFRADDYRAFVAGDIEKGEWKSDMAPVNTAHIRMVSEEQAEWLAKKALGQSSDMGLGSRFKVGEATIQKMGNELVWIAPLEFQGFRAWQTADTSPGYVIVDAEDPTKPAVLKDGFKLRYLPSAYLGDNLQRHLYDNGYRFTGTTDYSFEVDDEGNPFYVVVVYEPTIGYNGEQITGVAVVDPQTGDIVEYAPQMAPAWIDRIVPSEFAKDRLFDYGEYVHGWLNSWWGEDDVNVPTTTKHRDSNKEKITTSSLWLTWGDNGSAYWFAGLTSSKSSDDSLVGFVLMDSRTGHTREYQLPGGTNAIGVMEAVNSSVSNFTGWHATQPILYNIYGELTWAVPVVSDSNIFQRLALVRASNTTVVLGEDKKSALASYRQLIGHDGNTEAPSAQASLQRASGRIERIACPVLDGTTICYFTLIDDEPKRVFAGSVKDSLVLMLAHDGDTVDIGFLETTGSSVPVKEFRIIGFVPRAEGSFLTP